MNKKKDENLQTKNLKFYNESVNYIYFLMRHIAVVNYK